MSNKW